MKLLGFVIALALTLAIFSKAQPNVVQFNCGAGQTLWLWGEGADFSCQRSGMKRWNCSDAAAQDTARGSCAQQCEEIRSGQLASCYYGSNDPTFVQPLFSIICPNGPAFDISAAQAGDSCEKTADAGGTTTGGRCGPRGANGQINDPTVVIDCRGGCIQAQKPGDCILRP